VWPVTDRFIQALTAPHKYKSVCTVTVPGGSGVDIEIKAGSLSVTGGSRIRRRLSGLLLIGDQNAFEIVSTPGAVFSITHGIAYGSSDELVPVFYGEAVAGSQRFGDGTITVTLTDQGSTLAACKFSAPYAPSAATTRVAAITAVVTGAIAGVSVSNLSTDTGTIGSAQVWSDNPGDVIAQLTRDGGTEAYFGPDGVFYIRDLPTTATPYVWTAGSGAGGTLVSAERTRPLDRLYNRVVVRPSDSAMTWTQQVATITDTASPLHATKINTRTYPYSSPTIGSGAEALIVANQLLDRFKGITETLSLTAIANPALEANDSIRVITPQINNVPAAIFQHFIDNITLSLGSGDMSLATRSQVVTDE
jgi:hypothetical protein